MLVFFINDKGGVTTGKFQ